MHDYILNISCPDTTGIVYNVSKFLFDHQCNILDSSQFGDESTNLFFLRVHFSLPTESNLQETDLRLQFASVAKTFSMKYEFFDVRIKPRVLLLVSRFGHCLNDLLFRWKTGQLPCEIPAIASNHQDFALLANSYGVPFYHLSVNGDSNHLREMEIRQIVENERIDLMVLARYMQILSPALCFEMLGRIINIHHSFLPSFKGAKPYQQAFDRGVKLIGATAHYVTSDLDEGPIIEQDVARVDHSMTPAELTARGQDTECLVLARAVKWHCEHRVVLNGHKTVVFQ
jgi:formyltetrahydrofolate deformylase